MVMKSLCNEWLASFATRDYENVTIGAPAEESDEVFLKAACTVPFFGWVGGEVGFCCFLFFDGFSFVFVHRKFWVLFLFIGSVGCLCFSSEDRLVRQGHVTEPD